MGTVNCPEFLKDKVKEIESAKSVHSTMALYGGVGNFGVKILYCFFLPPKALLLAYGWGKVQLTIWKGQ